MSSPSGDRPNEQTTDEGRDEARDREESAVEAATAERRSDGVRVDAHGEYEPDPYPEEQDPGDTAADVIEQHRRQAERVEHHPDVPRADE